MAGDRNNTWHARADFWEKLKPQARRVRAEQTEAEKVLWERLRKSQLNGVRFRRQHPIDQYIVDFMAPEQKLIVELDGGIHLERKEADAVRDEWLEHLGYRVIRFPNNEVMDKLETVVGKINQVLNQL